MRFVTRESLMRRSLVVAQVHGRLGDLKTGSCRKIASPDEPRGLNARLPIGTLSDPLECLVGKLKAKCTQNTKIINISPKIPPVGGSPAGLLPLDEVANTSGDLVGWRGGRWESRTSRIRLSPSLQLKKLQRMREGPMTLPRGRRPAGLRNRTEGGKGIPPVGAPPLGPSSLATLPGEKFFYF
ncbi:hypothetical protein CRG98_028243 [Punica granatum]|uniref:Uncharacterized protein n=1 Tax=Punica granatum TaxID=22663 RepID=A0A2I0J577_PUNGR|nr:hypothetical protein CRG98_028243 [Punica granatum]